MSDPIDAAALRAILARAGLSLPEDRLQRLVSAAEAARESGRVLAAIDMAAHIPPAFHPPGPRDA